MEPEAVVIAEKAPEKVAIPEKIDIELFSKIILKVGVVLAAESLPKSKKLLKLQIDLGEQAGARQVLAGIAAFYAPEALVGKKVVVVSNLKPAKLMGEISEGMVLAGASENNEMLTLVDPGQELPIGSIVR